MFKHTCFLDPEDCVFRSFELQWADVGGSWVSSACDGTFCRAAQRCLGIATEGVARPHPLREKPGLGEGGWGGGAPNIMF